jgi:light-regulated signal transduction histidine kinase (bacteriophytochrome)
VEKKPLDPVVGVPDARKLRDDPDAMRTEVQTLERQLRTAYIEQAIVEDLLRKKSEELTTANQELDMFTGSVAHGLRNSLQTIAGFSQTLLKFYYDRLDDTGKDCLTRIQAGTRRMKDVIEGLLELSRISSLEISREEVNLSSIAVSCCSELRAYDPRRSVECIVAPDLRAQADPGLAKILIENLLKNAWKFTVKKETARVEFGSIDERGLRFFFVRDNGIGFDPSHAGKLFRPLQHLHKEEAIKGPGLGLAMVKRIILKHGGSVWAHAEKGNGATFYFHFSRASR